MFAIHVPTVMRRVAVPMSWAVAITSLLTSVAKIASNPASSASRAMVCTWLAVQPAPGMTASASRSAMLFLPRYPRSALRLPTRAERAAPLGVGFTSLRVIVKGEGPEHTESRRGDLREPASDVDYARRGGLVSTAGQRQAFFLSDAIRSSTRRIATPSRTISRSPAWPQRTTPFLSTMNVERKATLRSWSSTPYAAIVVRWTSLRSGKGNLRASRNLVWPERAVTADPEQHGAAVLH